VPACGVAQKPPNRLSDPELLLLLDMCVNAEQKSEERLADAIRTFQGTRVSYLEQLIKHYAGMRENFVRILHERGRSADDIQHQLKQFPERPSLGCELPRLHTEPSSNTGSSSMARALDLVKIANEKGPA
jgi:hypothetical protein